MAVRKNTIPNFVNDFRSSMLNVEEFALSRWNKWTLQTLADAQSKAPVASGTLEGSGGIKRATITSKGIESAIVFKVDYAEKLNDFNSGLKLKKRGELSYYSAGTQVFKQRKGVLGFATKAKDKNKSIFKELTQWAVSKSFLNI